MLNRQHSLTSPLAGAHPPYSRGERRHADAFDLDVSLVGLALAYRAVVVGDGVEHAPYALVDDLLVPVDVLRQAHGGAEADVLGTPDVLGRGDEVVGDADEGTRPGGSHAPPLLVELLLRDAGEGEVVVGGGEGARDGVVKGAVEAAVGVCRRDDGVEGGIVARELAQSAVVDADGDGGREGLLHGGEVPVVHEVILHAEQVDAGNLGVGSSHYYYYYLLPFLLLSYYYSSVKKRDKREGDAYNSDATSSWSQNVSEVLGTMSVENLLFYFIMYVKGLMMMTMMMK